MNNQIDSRDYASHQEVLIYFSSNDPVRFWFPKDRPLKHVIEAILKADPPPFADLNQSTTYDLRREWHHQVDSEAAEDLAIDQTLDLMRLQLSVGEGIRLIRRELPAVKLLFQDGNTNLEWPVNSGLVIGNSKDQTSSDGTNMLDLGKYARGEWARNISRRHARIFDYDGQYHLQVLHPNGVYVDGKWHEDGDQITLEDGMRLIFVQFPISVRIGS